MKGLVSVIIPAYNRPIYLRQAIESVLCQTYSAIEIIVVDDGSIDGGAEIQKVISPYLSLPNFTYSYQGNSGTAAAVNEGLALAKGEYIQRLDDDDRFLPQRISRCVDVFEKQPSVGMVATGYHVIDASGARGRRVSVHSCPSDAGFLSALMRLTAIPSAVMVKALVHRKIGGYRTDLEGTEDHEMWIRIARKYPIYALDEPLTEYRRHDGNLSHERNHERFARPLLRFTHQYLRSTSPHELVPNAASVPHVYALRCAIYLLRHSRTVKTTGFAKGELDKGLQQAPYDPLLSLWRGMLAIYGEAGLQPLPWEDNLRSIYRRSASELLSLLEERKRLSSMELPPFHKDMITFRQRFGRFQSKLIAQTFQRAIGK